MRDLQKKKDLDRKYRAEHVEEIARYQKEYRRIHGKEMQIKRKDYFKEYMKKWREKNKEAVSNYNKEYATKNRKIISARDSQYRKNRRKTDIQFLLRVTLRGRLGAAIKGNAKTGSAVKDLGCSIEQLKFYLEGKFTDGMSWKNYGMNGWHLDHVIPLDFFDLTDREQLLKACHYTNLQPLWAIENIKKSNKYV